MVETPGQEPAIVLNQDGPIRDLKKRVRLALHFGRDAHGHVTWAEKDRWREGYDAAKAEVLAVLNAK